MSNTIAYAGYAVPSPTVIIQHIPCMRLPVFQRRAASFNAIPHQRASH